MEIKWIEINSKPYLKFIFDEYLEEQQALDTIVQWRKEFNLHANSKISIIWDCSKMHGYNPQARIHWQNAIKELKSQTETIWLISSSLIIRTGANIISRFVGISINAIDSENKIK